MNNYKYIVATVLSALLIIFQTGCSDDLNEIKEINYDRVFSPTYLEALVINGVNVRLTWTKNSSAHSYVIELFENDSLSFEGSPAITLSMT